MNNFENNQYVPVIALVGGGSTGETTADLLNAVEAGLVPGVDRVEAIAVGAGGDEAPKAARKWLPDPENVNISSYTIIYGAKVATISIADDNTPYGVIIEDNGAAGMQRLLFDRLWETLPDEHKKLADDDEA